MAKGKVTSTKNTMGTMMPHPPKGKMNTSSVNKSAKAPGFASSPRSMRSDKVKAAKKQ